MTSQQEDEYDRMMTELSLRYQLQPGRFRFQIPEQDRTIAYMVNAEEWVPRGCRILSITRVSDSEVVVVTREAIYRVPVKGLEKMIEDVIERAELGPEDAEYLRRMPRVRVKPEQETT